MRSSRMYDRRGDRGPPFDWAAEVGFFPSVGPRWRGWNGGHLQSRFSSVGPRRRLTRSAVVSIHVSYRPATGQPGRQVPWPIFHSQFVHKPYFLDSENNSSPWICLYKAARTYQNTWFFFFLILAWILRSWKPPLPARHVCLCMFDTAFSNSSFGAQGLNVKPNAQPGWAALLTGAALMLACTWNGNGLCYPSSKEFLVLSLHEMDCLWGDNVCSIPF